MIASVRDAVKINDLFAYYHPDIVYHAAAHKHVPLMEDAPHEAIKNNVFGTLNVADFLIFLNAFFPIFFRFLPFIVTFESFLSP